MSETHGSTWQTQGSVMCATISRYMHQFHWYSATLRITVLNAQAYTIAPAAHVRSAPAARISADGVVAAPGVGTSERCFDAIVVLPYTRVKRRSGVTPPYRMSHFTARCVLAGLELYQQGVATRFILPGEQRAPATSDLEQDFLARRGVGPERMVNLPNLNGTLDQLEPIARLQRQGSVKQVLVVCFAFHAERVREYMRLLGIRGEVAEVEHTHAEFLRVHARAVRIDAQELVNLPQLRRVIDAERAISRALLRIERPFGVRAPATRLFKLLAGPTITDIERGGPRVGLARVEATRSLAAEAKGRVTQKLLGPLFRAS